MQAGVAGAGTGTLLVSLAKNLPDANPYKSWLIIIAPTVTILITWIAKSIERYLKKRNVRKLKIKLKISILEMKKQSNITPQLSAEFDQMLLDVDMEDISNLWNKIKNIREDMS